MEKAGICPYLRRRGGHRFLGGFLVALLLVNGDLAGGVATAVIAVQAF
jgi:hypothetical protein